MFGGSGGVEAPVRVSLGWMFGCSTDALGVRRDEVQIYAIESEDRARMEATDLDLRPQPVKLVIASYSITDAREQMPNVMFSESYLHTEQSVLTLPDHPRVTSLEDLKGKRVCSLSSSTSETQVEKAGADLKRVNRVGECLPLLDRGEVDAVSTDAAILGGFKAKFPDRYDHWDLGLDETEAWGISTGANEALRDLVNVTLYRSYADPEDSRWEDAYEASIRPEMNLQTNKGPDGVGLPLVPLARPQQPFIDRPAVRELPWEELTP